MNSEGLVKVVEGTTELLVPEGFNRKGPGTRTGEVFYNKQMEFGRDLSVLFGRATFTEGQKVLDGLAATGARGLRLANECGVKGEFVLNDRSMLAAVLMKQNASVNSLDHVRVECRDLRSLLADEQFDYIDIDPFGTPVEFIDPAVQSVRNKGVLAITATDTAPLHGTYPKTSLRRYGALSARSPFSHETGLRILVGFVVREAAKLDRAVEPLLCFHADHYFRCYLRVVNGAARADAAIKRLGFAGWDRATLARQVGPERQDPKDAGPLWLGPLFSKDLLDTLKPAGDLGTSDRCEKLIRIWREEAGAPPLFYKMDELAKKTKRAPPKQVDFIERLREVDPSASATHFDPKGVKTALCAEDLLELYSKWPRA